MTFFSSSTTGFPHLRPHLWALVWLVACLSPLPSQADASKPLSQTPPAAVAGKHQGGDPPLEQPSADGANTTSSSLKGSSKHPRHLSRTPFPWRLLWASVCALVVVWPLLPRLRRRGNAATAVGLVLLAVATFVFRRFFFPEAFFHQNGHGAMWIEYALGGFNDYGDGFQALFGRPAQFGLPNPERAVFIAHGVLAALAVVAAWCLARAAGAPRAMAWALAVVMAIDPGLGRLAQSESYFGVMAWLLFLAAALLGSGARSGKVLSSRFVASVMGAGLIVSQVALVHPLGWVPAAFVPLAAWVGPGSVRRRARLLVASTIGIGITVLVAAAPEMTQILDANMRFTSNLGEIAVERATFLFKQNTKSIGLLALLTLVALETGFRPLTKRAHLRLALQLSALGMVFLTAYALHSLAGLTPWIRRAWWAPYLPGLLAPAAAAMATFRLGPPALARVVAALVLAVGLAFSLSVWREQTLLPADVQEAQFAMRWRLLLPGGANVFYLERAQDQLFIVPLYRELDVRVVPLTVENDVARRASIVGPTDYYYRSSVCSTHQAREFCARIEAEWELEPVAVAELPAIPSFPKQPYAEDPVRVGLYRVRALGSPSSEL